MEIVDFHTHAFPDRLAGRAIAALLDSVDRGRAYTDGTVSGLRRSMQAAGIARSVVLSVATKPEQVARINAGCAAWTAPDLVPFGALHPASPDAADEVSRLKAAGFKGVKLHPEFQGFHVDDPRAFPMYEGLCGAGLVAVFHAGKDPGPFSGDHGLPAAFKAVRRAFPRLKVVAAHMGGWRVWEEVERHTAGLPLFFDTAAVRGHLPREEFFRLARRHGTQRILFGSDSPWFDPAQELRWLESTGLSSGELEGILHGNADALLA